MASSPASRSHSTVRQLKWLVVVLVLSNIAIGAFSVVALRRADARYSELIQRTVPVLNDMQTLTAHAAEAMVATNPSRLRTMPLDAFLREANAALAEEASDRTHVLKGTWVTEAKAERQELDQAATAFSAAARAVLAVEQTGNVAEATVQRDRELRPAFDRYIIAITKAADVLEAEGRNANDFETKRNSNMSTLMLSFAGWPMIVVAALLVITTLFVLVLMMLFRGGSN